MYFSRLFLPNCKIIAIRLQKAQKCGIIYVYVFQDGIIMRDKIAFIGVGNMGGAILNGILASGIFSAGNVLLCDALPEKCARFTERGCIYMPSAAETAEAADVILLAIKPQQMEEVTTVLAPFCGGKLVISIAAGVPLARLCKALPGASVVRVMPNTPLQVGEGVSALCRANDVSDEDYALAFRIFSASGMAVEAPESMINPVTALTSSSIAYFARFIGDMCAWAKENGFADDRETLEMVCRSAIGSAQMLLQTEFDPRTLERAVTSPGGTTERAMAVFTERGLADTVSDAMDACVRRADELSGI